jgi:hypothetical protein
LANAGRNTFCAARVLTARSALALVGEAASLPYSYISHQGTGVCPFGKGEALGCSLPASINVGRTTPDASGFSGRELGRRDLLVCSERVSFFAGLGVSGTTGLGVGAASESDWPDLFVCDGLGLFSRSAAMAPATRICSSVGSADADFLRDLGLGRSGSGVADSEGVRSGGGAACFGASGFASRATITSCARGWPTRMKLQSSTMKNPLGVNGRDKQLQPVRKPPFTKRRLSSWPRDLDHRQGKTQLQFVFQINLNVM